MVPAESARLMAFLWMHITWMERNYCEVYQAIKGKWKADSLILWINSYNLKNASQMSLFCFYFNVSTCKLCEGWDNTLQRISLQDNWCHRWYKNMYFQKYMLSWTLFALHSPEHSLGTYWTLHYIKLWTITNAVINIHVSKKSLKFHD